MNHKNLRMAETNMNVWLNENKKLHEDLQLHSILSVYLKLMSNFSVLDGLYTFNRSVSFMNDFHKHLEPFFIQNAFDFNLGYNEQLKLLSNMTQLATHIFIKDEYSKSK